MILDKFEYETEKSFDKDFYKEFEEKISKLDFSELAVVHIITRTSAKKQIGVREYNNFRVILDKYTEYCSLYMFSETDDTYPDEKIKIIFFNLDDEDDYGDEIFQDLRSKINTKFCNK